MKKISSATILILLIALTAFAQMDAPASLQVAMYYNIFDFDPHLTQTPGRDVVLGIFYNPNDPRSNQAKEEIKENFSQLSYLKIGGKNVIIKELTTTEQFHGINIVYVTPGSDASINDIVEKCHRYKILSISGMERYVQEGLAIAVKLENQKPKIIINKISAELSGENLSSKILALAKVI